MAGVQLVCGSEEDETRHSDWMSEIPGLYGARVGQVMWPGTHDSGAFCDHFDYTRVVSGDRLRRYGTHLLNYSWQGARDYVSKWTQTQSLTVYEQLMHGVRYLDLRVSKCLSDGGYFIVHSFCGPSLEQVLDQIHCFAIKHEKEVILVEVVPCSFVDHMELHTLIGQKLGDLLLKREPCSPLSSPVSLPLSHLMNNGRIILFYSSSHTADANFFWDRRCLYAPFIESLDPDAKEQFQLEHFEQFCAHFESQRHTKMFHFMYALTPRLSEIVGSLFRHHCPATLQECALRINPRLRQFTERIVGKWKENVSMDMGVVISVDYVQESDLVPLVVELNQRKFGS